MKSQHIKDYKNAFQYYLTKNIDPSNQSTVRGEEKTVVCTLHMYNFKKWWTKYSGQKYPISCKNYGTRTDPQKERFFLIHSLKRGVTKHGGLYISSSSVFLQFWMHYAKHCIDEI